MVSKCCIIHIIVVVKAVASVVTHIELSEKVKNWAYEHSHIIMEVVFNRNLSWMQIHLLSIVFTGWHEGVSWINL